MPLQRKQNQTFLIGKKLKTKDLRQTAAEREKRDGNKTQPKTQRWSWQRFKHDGLKRFFDRNDGRRLPQDRLDRINDILDGLHQAAVVADMNQPGCRLHPAAQSRPVNKLDSPFPASQRPVSGLSTPGWTLGIPPRS